MTAGRHPERIAQAFWTTAGGRRKFGKPVDLERAVTTALPLGICRMPALSTDKVAQLLQRIGAVPWTSYADRPLRGCLVADVGVGLIFIDGDDAPNEQRYSLAHEVAHFLAHYLDPRRRVLDALGQGMSDVLDRVRPPTMAERLSAALRDVHLEPFRHAMAREPDGRGYIRTGLMESEADILALELLVPAEEIRRQPAGTEALLAAEYGIPEWARDSLPTPGKQRRAGGVIEIFRK